MGNCLFSALQVIFLLLCLLAKLIHHANAIRPSSPRSERQVTPGATDMGTIRDAKDSDWCQTCIRNVAAASKAVCQNGPKSRNCCVRCNRLRRTSNRVSSIIEFEGIELMTGTAGISAYFSQNCEMANRLFDHMKRREMVLKI